jgi:hypothetical protein
MVSGAGRRGLFLRDPRDLAPALTVARQSSRCEVAKVQDAAHATSCRGVSLENTLEGTTSPRNAWAGRDRNPPKPAGPTADVRIIGRLLMAIAQLAHSSLSSEARESASPRASCTIFITHSK